MNSKINCRGVTMRAAYIAIEGLIDIESLPNSEGILVCSQVSLG